MNKRNINKLRRNAFIFVFISLLLSCAGRNHHLGIWESVASDNEEITWRISDNSIVSIVTIGSWEPDIVTYKYKMDYSKNPIWLDMESDKEKLRCIVEFVSEDSFRIVGEENDEKPRPNNFKDDALVFRKLKKQVSNK